MTKELLKFITELPATENYTPNDRYQDFRQLFSSDQGQRVLHEMLSWGGMFKPAVSKSPVDPYLMAIQEGKRNIALRLLVTVNQEPPKRPTKTRNK